ncbi:hypothetical protein DPM19_08515 [Actinomadura craniellae]|uniref:4Fe4S-binding SPASM domain-containing protein n=1 Tax=Actinomadura craniellae TaxID=2231787 RepID=A0A365HC12_9ACTN|nr:hypothetical protein DPM19_08515 [Actinomadura craniellae]
MVVDRSEQRHMPWRLFVKILNDLRSIDFRSELSLHNYNEPLASDRIVDEYILAHETLPAASLTLYTNGDYMSPGLFGRLSSAGVARMRITRYPRRAEADPREQVASVRNWARTALGADFPVHPVRQHNGMMAVVQRSSVRVELLLPDIAAHFLDRGGTVRSLSDGDYVRTHPCNATVAAAAIDYQGRLKMCCNVVSDWGGHKNYFVGSLRRNSFSELWNSPMLSELRERHGVADWKLSAICRSCTHRMPSRVSAGSLQDRMIESSRDGKRAPHSG